MTFTELINAKTLLLDGGMGTMLQKKGLDPGDPPEAFNISNPDAVKEVHAAYLNAGSNIILTNTFGANRLNYRADQVEGIIRAGLGIARSAINDLPDSTGRFAALDIGPSGQLMEPYGDLTFEDAVSIFSDMVKAGVRYGADLIMIETMSDLYETKAALLAAKENSSLPVFISNTYQAGGKLMTGADPLSVIVMLEGMGADAIGVNCSLGPEQLIPVVETYLKYASVPVLVKPNAGLPRMDGDKVAYDITSETFAEITSGFAKKGARILGGCCGTTPEYIALLSEKVSDITPCRAEKDIKTFISSYSYAVDVDEIDPGSVPKLEGSSVDDLVDNAYDLEDESDLVWLDTSSMDSGEKEFIEEAVFEVQSAIRTPLMITAKDPAALDAALRVYKGKAAVRAADDSESYITAINEILRKYGGVLL